MLIINLKNHLVQLTKTLTSVTTLLVRNFQGANSKEGGTCLPQKVKKILLLSFLCIQYSEQIFLLICQEKPPTLKLDCNLILMKVLIFHCLFLQYASSYHWKKKKCYKRNSTMSLNCVYSWNHVNLRAVMFCWLMGFVSSHVKLWNELQCCYRDQYFLATAAAADFTSAKKILEQNY